MNSKIKRLGAHCERNHYSFVLESDKGLKENTRKGIKKGIRMAPSKLLIIE